MHMHVEYMLASYPVSLETGYEANYRSLHNPCNINID